MSVDSKAIIVAEHRATLIEKFGLEHTFRCSKCQTIKQKPNLDLRKLHCQVLRWRPFAYYVLKEDNKTARPEHLTALIKKQRDGTLLERQLRQAFPQGLPCVAIRQTDLELFHDSKPLKKDCNDVLWLKTGNLVLKKLKSSELTNLKNPSLGDLVDFIQLQHYLYRHGRMAPKVYGCLQICQDAEEIDTTKRLATDRASQNVYVIMDYIVGTKEGTHLDLATILKEKRQLPGLNNQIITFLDKLLALLVDAGVDFADFKPANVAYRLSDQRLMLIDAEPLFCVRVQREARFPEENRQTFLLFSNLISMLANSLGLFPEAVINHLLGRLQNVLAHHQDVLGRCAQWWFDIVMSGGDKNTWFVLGACFTAACYLNALGDVELDEQIPWVGKFQGSCFLKKSSKFAGHYLVITEKEVMEKARNDQLSVRDMEQFLIAIVRIAAHWVDWGGTDF